MERIKIRILELISKIDGGGIRLILLLLVAPLFFEYRKNKKYIYFFLAALILGFSFLLPTKKESQIIDYTELFSSAEKRGVPKKIVIHHTADARPYADLLQIYDYHKNKKGWGCGIAYHYIISDGKVYKIHDENDKTAHAYGYNSNSIAVCIHGDFSKKQPNNNDLIIAAKVVRNLCKKYNLEKTDIIGHRDCENNATECPGIYFDLEYFKKLVNL